MIAIRKNAVVLLLGFFVLVSSDARTEETPGQDDRLKEIVAGEARGPNIIAASIEAYLIALEAALERDKGEDR